MAEFACGYSLAIGQPSSAIAVTIGKKHADKSLTIVEDKLWKWFCKTSLNARE